MLTQNCTANKAEREDIEIFHYEEVINIFFSACRNFIFPSTFFIFAQVSTEELGITQWWLQPTRGAAAQSSVAGWAPQPAVGSCCMGTEGTYTPSDQSVTLGAGAVHSP